eukprot:TRINITY_DN3981_c0_g1_i1.p1 TRINITY_DN3981_c0_g1~~TRINITY_DN3981_c0_g1_i1.p1  ORF type:complete len:168 (+),score=46.67 TRINITY_DN3981_c0_g1_i1:70-573(+)
MAPCRKTALSTVFAAAGVAAACYAAGSAFIGSGVQTSRSLRGQEAQYVQIEQRGHSAGEIAGQPAASVATSLLAAAVAFGLVAGMSTQPAQAALGGARAEATQIVAVSDSSLSVAMKSFVNPSEELDADEQPFEDWSAEHPVQLILTGLIPVFIYLTFYILGSLEVI